MTPDDFPQFPDPRVREVMAAAANLVETAARRGAVWESELADLKTALFAAQHSQPKVTGHQPQLANFCGKCGHIAWLAHLKESLCLDCQGSQHSRPESAVGRYAITDAYGGCPSCQRGLGEFCEKCAPQLPNPCGGDHGNSYECHACVAGRKV